MEIETIIRLVPYFIVVVSLIISALQLVDIVRRKVSQKHCDFQMMKEMNKSFVPPPHVKNRNPQIERCPNCGAPVKWDRCEYCDTEFQKGVPDED